MIREAIAFAEEAHEGQVRKYTGEPYIEHPKEVMRIVAQIPRLRLEVVAAAVLHDVVEDTGVSVQDVYNRFGFNIATLVDEVTSPKTAGSRRLRKLVEAQRLRYVSWEAQTIKYADILSNLKDISQHDTSFAQVYAREKRWALLMMEDGYNPLRHAAWHKALEIIYGRK